MADSTPMFVAEDVASVSGLLDEGDALRGRREAALEKLTHAALPSRVEHLWRFTDPENLVPASLRPAGKAHAAPGDTAVAATVIMAPGVRPMVTLSDEARDAGLVVTSLSEAGDAASRLGEAAGGEAYFTTLNDVAWNTGLLVRAPAGTVFARPVHVIVESAGEASLPRLLIEAGSGAELDVVEEHRGGGDATRIVGVTELLLDANARVNHALIQAWSGGVHGHLGVHASLARDARLDSAFCTLGGRRAKHELVTTLAGEGARSEMVGVTLAGATQHLDHHTRHVHRAGRTSSDIDFKAVVAARARSSYTGLIRIDEQAREVEAFQENRNLLLTDTSRADTIPELEILNQEVSCSHGATVAPLDEDQVFYLRSRGLTTREARRLIIGGFVEKTLSRLPESLRERTADVVAAHLDRLEDGAS